jgi:hypothetical protein
MVVWLLNLPRLFARAILYPAASAPGNGIIRHILLKPRILDTLSLVVQLRDLSRRRRINDARLIDEAHYRKVQDYNASVTQRNEITRSRRAEELFRVLSMPQRDLRREELLLIGPRDVHEILLAWLYGYLWRNISGIDLYSTNPKITAMNMEAMDFSDEIFDAVFMSNTLAYAKNSKRCLAECVRVLKPGGRLVFGATYFPEGEYPGNHFRGQDVLDILHSLPIDLYFHRSVDKINALNKPQTIHFFGVVKHAPMVSGFDRIAWQRPPAA